MQIGMACDHGGFELKEELKAYLKSIGHEPIDMGTFNEDSVDYPDYGVLVAEKISRGDLERGILICGTGIGMSISANKFPNVRAAILYDEYAARYSRLHNDANIAVFGARTMNADAAAARLRIFLSEPFEKGRHERRVKKIRSIEKRVGRQGAQDA